MSHTILLFDMDGVLLHADGYHRALQASVELIGRNLGIEEPNLSKEHIANLEASGVTHEWESLVICTAILLTQIWRIDQNIRIPSNINPTPHQYLMRGEDYFNGFLQNIDLNGESPTIYTEALLLEQEGHLSAEQKEYLKFILRNGQDHRQSSTLHIFQEFVLGSRLFTQTYNRPSQLNTKSYLELYDRAALSKTCHDQLIEWLKSDSHHAAIFTNRPSKPLRGFFGTPEAELGAASIDLQDLPIIGAGALSWLANLETKPLHIYFKPNPVHALAAIQIALGNSLEQALKAALDFYNRNYEREIWLPLEGSTIIIFEDLKGGLVSAQSAQQLLEKSGIHAEMILVGIGKHPIKVKSLSPVAHHVIEDINHEILPEIIY